MTFFFNFFDTAGLLAGREGEWSERRENKDGGMAQKSLEHVGVPTGDEADDESR